MFGIQSLEEMVPVSSFLMILGLFILLTGGVVAFFRQIIGGIIAAVGIYFLSVPLHDALEGFDWLGLMGVGYFASWAGVTICFVYSFLMWRHRRTKLEPEERELPPPPPPPNIDASPAEDIFHPLPPRLTLDLRDERRQRL
jgi:hypothetical protein